MICKETALLLALRQRICQRVSLLSQRKENEKKLFEVDNSGPSINFCQKAATDVQYFGLLARVF